MRQLSISLTLAGLLSLSGATLASPVTINYAGFFLDTIGTNTLGLAGGGTLAGTPSTLFFGATTPDYYAGTLGVAVQNGVQVGALGLSNLSGLEWTRRVLNPSASQLTPLTVTFNNGADSASFTSRSLAGLSAMPLVQNLTVTGGADPAHPRLSWTVPAGAGDVDAVQIVLYDNVNNVEIVGSRVTLPANATSYTLASTAAPGADLTLNVRLVDVADPALGLAASNLLRESRSFVNYTAPVPESASWALMAAGLAAVGVRARQRSR